MAQFNYPSAYELLITEELADVKGSGFMLRHKKSGARICVIQNNDENKVFCVGFRTPPTDSTGVAHIIEHTVLCGSDKYPVKDPFIELAKGSLNTFLNAMTFPDKTIYPVASCNAKDFANLSDVYMDAVFHPNIYKREEIFKQEGWHYELESEEGELTYNGIVYSEMKGVYSNPDGLVARITTDALFPDTEYGVESGGDPEFIPDLTYDAYLDFHRRYYHPSNSYIFLYGDCDMNERLTWLDEEYLSKYDAIRVDSSVKEQKAFGGMREYTEYYSVDEENSEGRGVYYTYGMMGAANDDIEKGIAFEMLDYVLFGAPGAPVTQAILDAGMGDDVFSGYNSDFMQPFFSVTVKNAEKGQKDRFLKLVKDELAKIVKEGVDKKSLTATLNSQEFRYKEADFGRMPKGLVYIITVFSTWLYDDNRPFDCLKLNEAYKAVREKINTDYFEQIIKDYFLDTNHGVLITFEPKVGLNAEREAKTREKLAAYKASLTPDEVKKLVDDTKALKAYQSEENTPEELATIPLLSIDDIQKEAKPIIVEKPFAEHQNVLWHNIPTNDILYLHLHFEAKKVESEKVPYIGLLSDVLGLMDTKTYSYRDLADEVNLHTGGVDVGTGTYTSVSEPRVLHPNFDADLKVMYPEMEAGFKLLEETALRTVFTDSKRLKEILMMLKGDLESSFMSRGNSVAGRRAAAYLTEDGVYHDMVGGVAYYDFIKDLVDNFDFKKDEISARLKETSDRIFTRENLVVSITCDKAGLDMAKAYVMSLIDKLPDVKYPDSMSLKPVKKNEGLKTPGQVQYVVKVGDYMKAGVPFNGAFMVLRSVLSYGYLWNEVRVKGGAYGCSLSVSPQTGLVGASSYRDPNLKNTVDVYDKMVEYVENFEADEREMTKAVLGCFGGMDAPMTPRMEGGRSFSHYISGRTYEELQTIRDQARNCSAQDIRDCAKLLKTIVDENCICVVGASGNIEANVELFDNTRNIIG